MRSLARFALLAALGPGCLTTGTDPSADSVVITQGGNTTTLGVASHEVMYPIPFVSPPVLEVDAAGKATILHLEEKADRFVVTAAPVEVWRSSTTLKWKATGSVPRSAGVVGLVLPDATSGRR
ncbi:hypothetical protein R5W24_004192 [Gemmata sp. JC717]|uniref:Uncharacterized protein n=1 Tax=Gemmata algarum TaxID=2975278 RepID=A0ABU5F8H1_9BACT|nr:hypothetical protein [Gemmata algarum]MDY3555057.1 hypothetical protein [Gemmata algarum]MDY3563097.1 hypothetical protein [Gemmata algarum]